MLYLLCSLYRCYPFSISKFSSKFSRIFEFLSLSFSFSLFLHCTLWSQCNNITNCKTFFFFSIALNSFFLLDFLLCCHTIWHLTTNFNQHKCNNEREHPKACDSRKFAMITNKSHENLPANFIDVILSFYVCRCMERCCCCCCCFFVCLFAWWSSVCLFDGVHLKWHTKFVQKSRR